MHHVLNPTYYENGWKIIGHTIILMAEMEPDRSSIDLNKFILQFSVHFSYR